MPDAEHEFTAVVWMSRTRAGRYFLSLPEDVSDEIEAARGTSAGGFGAVPVEATIGGTTWSTSLFPAEGQGTYVLPVRKAVLVAANLTEGSEATVALSLRA